MHCLWAQLHALFVCCSCYSNKISHKEFQVQVCLCHCFTDKCIHSREGNRDTTYWGGQNLILELLKKSAWREGRIGGGGGVGRKGEGRGRGEQPMAPPISDGPQIGSYDPKNLAWKVEQMGRETTRSAHRSSFGTASLSICRLRYHWPRRHRRRDGVSTWLSASIARTSARREYHRPTSRLLIHKWYLLTKPSMQRDISCFYCRSRDITPDSPLSVAKPLWRQLRLLF